jgi:hypothetical protein
MTQPAKPKILSSRQEILDYTGLSPYLYLKFVRLGMPVLYIDGRCYAHTDNLDEFFRLITKSSAKNLPDEILSGAHENPAEKPPVNQNKSQKPTK